MSYSDEHNHASASTRNYDKESGQAFREWIVERLKPDQEEWFRRRKFLPVQGRSGLGVKGARNLVDSAIKVVSENISSLEPDDLTCVPLQLIYRIWDHMDKTHESISVQSWKIFAKFIATGHHKLPRLKLYKPTYEIINPAGALATYTKPLTSNCFDFIVHLSISGCASFDSHEFLSLPQLKNLGVLEILQPEVPEQACTFPRITDAIIRDWSQGPDPFPVLRVLRIWGDDFTTANSLQYLAKFPALAIYDVAGKSRDWEKAVQDFGWRSKRGAWTKGLFNSLYTCFTLLHAETVYPGWGESRKRACALLKWLTEKSNQGDRIIESVQRDQLSNALPPESISKNMLDIMDWLPCFNHAHFNLWGFLLYSHVGRLRSDQDFVAQGVSAAIHTFTMDGLVIPPRPFLSINLGQGCHRTSDIEGFILKGQPTPHHRHHSCCHGIQSTFEAHCTFARAEYVPNNHKKQPSPDFESQSGVKRPYQPNSTTGLTLKRRKGMSVEELIGPLSEFNGTQ
ncbi:hypothetical protein F4779DRAFT_568366 [Xylariaceae sp. FL0662B]|nr:hypothetical protein F4779DRAFT_568366 [Xylariaceae sp. FL0662B]